MKLKEKFQRFWTLSKSHKGFTLVELIVVIAILAILAGVAIPVYNGYIKKAQEAADEQLLDTINTAFAAACLTNGMDHVKAVAQISVDEDGLICEPKQTLSAAPAAAGYDYFLTVTYPGKGDVTTAVADSFAIFFAGNETAAFKGEQYVGKTLYLDKEGNFGVLEMSKTYSDLMAQLLGNTALADDITAFKSSIFATLAPDTLLGKVDFATDLAASLVGGEDPDERMVALIQGGANMNSLAQSLGFADAGADGFEEALDALVTEKAQMMAQATGGKAEDLMTEAANAILANNAVLNVATNSGFDANAFAKQLANGTAEQTIKDNLADGGDISAALSQAALTYGMYSAYAEKNNIPVSDEAAIGDVLDALDDPKFQEFMASADADVAGYMGAMQIVGESAKNQEVINDMLLNGFSTNDMQALLQGLVG